SLRLIRVGGLRPPPPVARRAARGRSFPRRPPAYVLAARQRGRLARIPLRRGSYLTVSLASRALLPLMRPNSLTAERSRSASTGANSSTDTSIPPRALRRLQVPAMRLSAKTI